jgi:GNAT superfamily N-acetyltransferase
MTVYLRPFEEDTDISRMAELLAPVARERRAADRSLRTEVAPAPGRVLYRVVAVEDGDRVVGVGETGREPWMLAGHFWVALYVALEARGQGIGSMLYDDLVEFAWEQGATRLLAHLDQRRPEVVRFAQSRGFAVYELVASRSLTSYGTPDYDPSDRLGLPTVCFDLDLVLACP